MELDGTINAVASTEGTSRLSKCNKLPSCLHRQIEDPYLPASIDSKRISRSFISCYTHHLSVSTFYWQKFSLLKYSPTLSRQTLVVYWCKQVEEDSHLLKGFNSLLFLFLQKSFHFRNVVHSTYCCCFCIHMTDRVILGRADKLPRSIRQKYMPHV